jgi:hypothetical protein
MKGWADPTWTAMLNRASDPRPLFIGPEEGAKKAALLPRWDGKETYVVDPANDAWQYNRKTREWEPM